LAVILLLSIAGSGLAAYGVFWANSNVVHVDVQYAVTLATSVNRGEITLTATVTNNASPVGAGINVDFYYSRDGGTLTYITSQLTDSNGIAQATYTLKGNGAYDFQATVVIS
jgi:hypothetical protein